MKARGRHVSRLSHVSEDALVACATLDGGADDTARAHLAVCSDCAARLDEVTRLLTDLRAGASDAADEVFDAQRLERQRDHILRRLEHAGRPARVIEFPLRTGRAVRPMRPFAVRWVAAAAAAGLVLGVYAGSQMNGVGRRTITDAPLARLNTPALPAGEATLPAAEVKSPGSDDEILSEIETALLTQRIPQLEAIDALTPRFREIGFRIR